MYKLIALDLDDTLLGRDGKISPANRKALDEARARGCEVTLVTARTWNGTTKFVKDLALTAPIVCVTGAAIYRPDGEVLSCRPLLPADARQLTAWADAESWSVRVYFQDDRIIQSRPAADFVPHIGAQFSPVGRFAGAVSPYLDGGEIPLQMVLLGHSSVEGVLAHLPALPEVAATTYERGGEASRTHLLHRAVSKGAGLASLCSLLGVAQSDVIAMGDSDADRSMLAWAGMGVAMGWGTEGARQAANLVMPVDEPDAVAAALRKLLG